MGKSTLMLSGVEGFHRSSILARKVLDGILL